MVLVISSEVIGDTRLLIDQSPEVVESLGGMVIDHLTHGSTTEAEKLIRKAAKSLGVEVSALTATIHALSFLLLDSAKRHLTSEDFTASLSPLSLPSSHVTLLTSLYSTHSRTLHSLLSSSSLSLPSYRDLDWRLDIILHTRAASHLTTPTFLLRLTTHSSGHDLHHWIEADYPALLALERDLDSAVKSLNTKEAARIRRYVK